MATDIFNREIQFGGSFAADKAKLKFGSLAAAVGSGGTDLVGFLVQNLNLTYTQQIAKLYEVGGNHIYYVGGRTQGTVAIGRIIGPKSVAEQFYTTYGDICQIKENANNIDFELNGADCGSDGNAAAGANVTYNAQFCVITTVGFSVQAQDMMINEQVQLMIGSLKYT